MYCFYFIIIVNKFFGFFNERLFFFVIFIMEWKIVSMSDISVVDI